MDQVTMPDTAVSDRRQLYRPFLERLNPVASSRSAIRRALIVPREFDPRDPKQPAIHEVFASTAELNRGTQMALVGGIGSGKTTELLLTLDRLKRHADAVNIYLDASEFTDFLQTNPGAMLAAIGLRLFAHIRKRFGEPSEDAQSAHAKLRELAHGKTEWWNEDPRDYEGDDGPVPVDIPGLMKPRFPQLTAQVKQVTDLLRAILLPFVEHDSQITVVVDGLDRLIEPVRFREFAEQDLRAIRGTTVTVILAAPLLLWFDKSRFLQAYFDLVRHIPAAAADPKQSVFLKAILKKRGADELLGPASMSAICRFSGGVLRDLLELAQSSAQYAYLDAADSIDAAHVRAAVHQLGNRYLAGVGATQRRLIRRLLRDKQFTPDSSDSRELLANRQVLEYSNGGRDYFLVHPALAKVLPEPK
jgi:energy-coupling factor transporter ATP-binding protein EcfA2